MQTLQQCTWPSCQNRIHQNYSALLFHPFSLHCSEPHQRCSVTHLQPFCELLWGRCWVSWHCGSQEGGFASVGASHCWGPSESAGQMASGCCVRGHHSLSAGGWNSSSEAHLRKWTRVHAFKSRQDWSSFVEETSKGKALCLKMETCLLKNKPVRNTTDHQKIGKRKGTQNGKKHKKVQRCSMVIQ